jgi:hypothetical protein
LLVAVGAGGDFAIVSFHIPVGVAGNWYAVVDGAALAAGGTRVPDTL